MSEQTISKTIRLPLSLVQYIDQAPGDNFSQKLVGLLEDYQHGDEDRQRRLESYQRDIRQYSDLYCRLVSDYRRAHSNLVVVMRYLDELYSMAQKSLPEIRADTADQTDPDLRPGALPFT